MLHTQHRWSPARACVALTLDASGCLQFWDFARDTKAPVATLQIEQALPAAGAAGGQPGGSSSSSSSRHSGSLQRSCLALEVSPSPPGVRLGDGQQRTLSMQHRSSSSRSSGAAGKTGAGAAAAGCYVVTFGDGTAEWHLMPRWMCEEQPGDVDALLALLLG